MQPFLYETAKDIYSKYNLEKGNVCVVFPNKRAGIYFRKYFAEISNKTSWSPVIVTISSLVQHITKLRVADPLTLLYDLYISFNKVTPQNISEDEIKFSTFDKFYNLGEVLLRDFNEIDNYIVNTEKLFGNIRDLEEIDSRFEYLTDEQKEALQMFWKSFSTENLSKEKQRLLQLWERIPLVYKQFKNNLNKKNYAYEGMIYRQAVDCLEKNTTPIDFYEKIIFIGFNALSKSEEKIFEILDKRKKAVFYWDADSYYVHNDIQEAGFHLRYNIKKFSPRDIVPSNLLGTPKNIELIGIPLNVGQAKALPTVFKQFGFKLDNIENQQKTAIVLADEQLLFPVLYSIPQEIEYINITMGYPFASTNLYTLLVQYISLQRYAKISKKNSVRYYYKDVMGIVRNPEIWFIKPENAQLLIELIEKNNLAYIEPELLNIHEDPIYELIFTPVTEPKLLFTNILNLLFILFKQKHPEAGSHEKDEGSLDGEYIYQVYIQLKRLLEILENKTNEFQEEFSFEISLKLIQQVLNSIRIPFSGEPLKGLQVMGVLETRNIDFENIVMLNINEGNFPSANRPVSMISESLRVAYEMPTLKYQDAMYAYYFYRLIQRAKNIVILYNNVTSGSNKGELSRFVQQLLYETEANATIKITQHQFRQKVEIEKNEPIVINKTPEILKLLKEYVFTGELKQKKLSASAINTFIDCKLKFYFRYLAKVQSPATVEEEINQADFGNILHESIELLYARCIQKNNSNTIKIDDFEFLENSIEDIVNHTFITYFTKGNRTSYNLSGNQLIVKEVITTFLKTILKYDKKYAPFQIISMEGLSYRGKIGINALGESKRIAVEGKFDRLDCKDGIYRIIDYKTGSIEKKFSEIPEIFDAESNKRNAAIVQIFLYASIFRQNRKYQNVPFYAGFYNIREMINDDFSEKLIYKALDTEIELDDKSFPVLLKPYEEELKTVLEFLFHPETSFYQTEDKSVCNYCDYKLICRR